MVLLNLIYIVNIQSFLQNILYKKVFFTWLFGVSQLFVCLFVCPIITQELLDRFISNFDLGKSWMFLVWF